MKIIKNNATDKVLEQESKIPIVLQVKCEQCASELEITKEDAHIGALGCQYITCPCCGEESLVIELDCITLTMDNIEFPTHFHRTSSVSGQAKEVNADSIKKEIRRGIEYLRQNKDAFEWYVNYGDLFLIIKKYPGDAEYWVVVTKDFYHTNIPFALEDYGE